jgi:hypothetical protein
MKAIRKVHRISKSNKKKMKEIIETFGVPSCWNVLHSLLNLSVKNLRDHYRDYMKANVDPFTEDEDKLIFSLVEKGLTFQSMTSHFSNRPRVHLRNRYQKLQRERLMLKSSVQFCTDDEFLIFDQFIHFENSAFDSPVSQLVPQYVPQTVPQALSQSIPSKHDQSHQFEEFNVFEIFDKFDQFDQF